MDVFALGIALVSGLLAFGAVNIVGSGVDLAQKLDYFPEIKQVKFLGLSVRLVMDFRVVNPTQYEVKLSYPLVMLYISKSDKVPEEDFIAQNIVYNQTFVLRPFSEIIIPNLTFDISLSSILKLLEISYDRSFSVSDLYHSVDKLIQAIRKNITYKLYIKVNSVEIKYKSTLEGLGYSPVSAIDRPIRDCSEFDKYFKDPQRKEKRLAAYAEAENTVELMKQIIKQDAHLIKDFSEHFRSENVKETAKKIYDFVYNCLKYNIEKGEQLKNPLVSYYLAQKKAREFYKEHGYYHPDYAVDCDDIAIFIGSILYNLNIPFALRLAKYNSSKGYQHVYIVAYDYDGSEVIIDPVFWQFNAEKQPVKKKDIPFSGVFNPGNSEDGVMYLYGLGDVSAFDMVASVLFPPYGLAKLANEYYRKAKSNQSQYKSVNQTLVQQIPQDSLFSEFSDKHFTNNKNKTKPIVYILIAGGVLVPISISVYEIISKKHKK